MPAEPDVAHVLDQPCAPPVGSRPVRGAYTDLQDPVRACVHRPRPPQTGARQRDSQSDGCLDMAAGDRGDALIERVIGDAPPRVPRSHDCSCLAPPVVSAARIRRLLQRREATSHAWTPDAQAEATPDDRSDPLTCACKSSRPTAQGKLRKRIDAFIETQSQTTCLLSESPQALRCSRTCV